MSRFVQNCTTDARERCLSFDIEQKCNQDCKSSSQQTDPGYRNPGPQKRISIYVLLSQTLGDMMSYSNGAGRANARPHTQSPAPVISKLGSFL